MEVLLVILAILFQCIFTASETSLVRLDRQRLKELARSGVRWAKSAIYFLDHPDEFFTIILVCEDLALVAASILLTTFFVESFGEQSTVFAIVSLSLFSLLVGQYLPKAVALILPEQVMSLFANFLMLLKSVLIPISLPFTFLSKIIYRRSKTSDYPFRRRDIVTALDEVERSASRILARLFAFHETKVDDVMIPIDKVVALPETVTLEQIKQRNLLQRPYTRIPVYRDDPREFSAVLNLKDVIYHGRIRLRPVPTIPSGMRAMPLFKIMKEEGEHMAIILDEHGKTRGIITLDDLIEELVGEIRDEV